MRIKSGKIRIQLKLIQFYGWTTVAVWEDAYFSKMDKSRDWLLQSHDADAELQVG